MPRLICLLALAGALMLLPAQSPFAFREVNADSLELSESGRPVFVYNHGMILKEGFPEKMRRSTYLHPVYTPGGVLITDDFNPDHAHHRGISWMWPVVTVGGRTYDLWTIGGILQKFGRWTARETKARHALLGVENGWYVGDSKVVNEQVEIRAHRAQAGKRLLEFVLRFEASGEPVDIAGTPDQKKGFGGFCFRFAPRDGGKEKTIIRTDRGIAKQDGIMAVHPWAQIEGTFNGRPAGARVEDLASNPGFPNGWLMRHGFGFLNVSYPGLETHRLERGRPLVLQYRVMLFDGEAPPPPSN